MCPDRVVTGKQFYAKSDGVDIELRIDHLGANNRCIKCSERLHIVPQYPWNKALTKKGRIKDKSLVWMRHYNTKRNINDAIKIYELDSEFMALHR